MTISKRLLEEVQATEELCGSALSEGALAVLAGDLEGCDEAAIFSSLRRCRAEVRGRLNLAEILNRVDDGHPGPEEAWAMLPRDEFVTVVWTQQMASAWGLVRHLMDEGDMVAARMAFREAYVRLVGSAREERRRPQWSPSLGHDVSGREMPLREAVAKGRLTKSWARSLLPPPGTTLALLSGPSTAGEVARRKLSDMRKIVSRR